MVFLPTKAVILDDEILTNDWKSYYGMIRDFIAQFVGGDKAESVVISDGVITPTKGFVVVDSENELNVDEISQIKIDNYVDGSFIALTMANKDHTIVLKQGESADGGIFTYTGANETMKMGDVTLLRRDGNYWRQVDLSGYMRATDDEMGLMSSKYKTASLNQLAPYLENRSLYAVGVLVWAVRKPEGMVPCDNSIEYRLDQFPAVSTLLNNGVLPKVTYSAYNSAISSTGICASFGYDSTNKKFYPPYLKPRVIEGTSYYPYISLYNAVTAQSLIDQQGILDECMALYADMKTEYQNFVKYVDEQMMSISDAVDDAVATINTTKNSAVSVVNSTKDTAVQTVNNTATSAVQRVEDAYSDFDTLYQEKTQGLITTANNQIVNIDNASQENIAKSRTWATGEDAEVEVLEAGEHSSRGYADLAMSIANADEDVPVDASKLVALDAIRGPRGYNGKDGVGIPVGGNIGQALVKKSGTDYEVQWSTLDTLPSQTDNANKFLSTDGTNASWMDIGKTLDTSITNCITEIPQDIKLELNTSSNQITLKKDSILYIPDGFDGSTPKFIRATISSDQTGGPGTGNYVYCYNPSRNLFGASQVATSGAEPETPQAQQYWYDTANNKVKRYINNAWVEGFSLPFCIASTEKIIHTFNGFGYIGSTVFALPGVKGLIPNGRNADGSLKNIEFTIPQVQTFTHTSGTIDRIHYFCYPTGSNLTIHNYFLTGERPTSGNRVWYDTANNIVYFCENWGDSSKTIYVIQALMFGWSKLTNSVISDLQAKLPFHAVDQNDSSWISAQAMPSGKYIDLTVGATDTNYTAPANGWFAASGSGNTAGQFIYFATANNSVMRERGIVASNGYVHCFIPCKRGDYVRMQYNTTNKPSLYFIYAEGESR